MQKSSNIHAISNTMNNTMNIAPPSYAEAIGQSASTRNNPYVSTSDQPVSYDQGSQIPGYPSYTAAPNYFYSNISNQPPYTLAYVSATSNQQNQPADSFYLANTAVIARREDDRKCHFWKLFCKIVFFVIIAFVLTGIVFNVFF